MDIKGQARERARPDADYPSKKIDIDSDVASTDSSSGEDAVSLKQISDLYNKLKSGYDVSKQEISKAKKDGRFEEVAGLGYGEVDAEAFGKFVRALPRSHKDGTFLDLGSGSGKAVLAAAFAGSFASCVGVEIVAPLCKLANEALESARAIDEERAATIKFVEGDMFKQQDLWRMADVVLVTCTLFTDEMMQQLDQNVEEMLRPNTIVVTTTRRLSTKRARLVSEGRVKYAKGSLLFIVYVMT